MHEDADQKNYQREHDRRDAQGVAGAVHGMLMAGGVLGDPLFRGAVAGHSGMILRVAREPAVFVSPQLAGAAFVWGQGEQTAQTCVMAC